MSYSETKAWQVCDYKLLKTESWMQLQAIRNSGADLINLDPMEDNVTAGFF